MDNKSLIIDTSSNIGMTAVLSQTFGNSYELLSMNLVSSSSSHSERLFEAVDRVLKDSKTSIHEVSRIIFSAGPGSFTGLRISFSAVKGFAMGADKEIISVSTLKSLAQNLAGFRVTKAVLLSDTKGEVFAYIVDADNNILLDECSIKIEDLCQKLKDIGGEIYCIGNGALLYNNELLSLSGIIVPQNKTQHIISAFSMAHMADLEPLKDLNYIKASYAETKLATK